MLLLLASPDDLSAMLKLRKKHCVKCLYTLMISKILIAL
jgi:hypothetical protein